MASRCEQSPECLVRHGCIWKASGHGLEPQASAFWGLDVVLMPLGKRRGMDDGVVFGSELAYMGLHGNHAAAAGSGCGCRPVEGTAARNSTGTSHR